MLNIFDYFVYRIIRSYKGNIKNHKYDRFYPMVFANIFLFIPLNIAIYFGGMDRFWVLMVFLGIHYIGWDIFCAKRYTPARYLKFKEKASLSSLAVSSSLFLVLHCSEGSRFIFAINIRRSNKEYKE